MEAAVQKLRSAEAAALGSLAAQAKWELEGEPSRRQTGRRR